MSHYNCCVPHCTNSFRNAPYLHYYRIPKDPDVRKKYVVLIRNETLKVNSESTRICSAHFDGGEKLSRTHLPSIFPWTKQMVARRQLKRVSFEEENGGTFSLSRLANVKFTQDVKCERKTSQSSAPWKTDPI